MKSCCRGVLVVFGLVLLMLLYQVAKPVMAMSIRGSKHDLTSLDERAGTGVMVGIAFNDYKNACVYCHTPHRTTGNESRGYAPLWNRDYPVTHYDTYQSSTLDSLSNQPSGVTLACLSCHDGSLAVDRIINKPSFAEPVKNASRHMRIAHGGGDNQCSQCHKKGEENINGVHDLGIAAFGSNLADDHPVSISYPNVLQDEKFNPNPVNGVFANGVKLFSGKVECASCHDVHNATTVPFLRTGLEGSALCMTCHVK